MYVCVFMCVYSAISLCVRVCVLIYVYIIYEYTVPATDRRVSSYCVCLYRFILSASIQRQLLIRHPAENVDFWRDSAFGVAYALYTVPVPVPVRYSQP